MAPINPTNTPPSIPFKIANAYGVKPISVRPIAQPTAEQSTAKITRGADQLLAGSVNSQVDFMADTPAKAKPSGSSLAFYRHPADTNAAATSIDLGRSLDVEG